MCIYMCLYTYITQKENPKYSIKKLLELKKRPIQNIQKYIAFLHTNNEL